MDDKEKCIFCHIANGRVESRKVYEDDLVVAVLDINPAVPGHILVIPKEHIAVMPQMSRALIDRLGAVAKKLSLMMLKNLGAEGTTVFIANGMAAGQRAPHFMMHVIPRKDGDNVLLQPDAIQMSSEEVNEVVSKLAPAVQKQFGGEAPAAKPQEQNKPDLDKVSELLTK